MDSAAAAASKYRGRGLRRSISLIHLAEGPSLDWGEVCLTMTTVAPYLLESGARAEFLAA